MGLSPENATMIINGSMMVTGEQRTSREKKIRKFKKLIFRIVMRISMLCTIIVLIKLLIMDQADQNITFFTHWPPHCRLSVIYLQQLVKMPKFASLVLL